jgi:type I restriction enzyme S subunit
VERLPLGEIATITIGEFVHKTNQDSSALNPVYNGGTTPTGYYGKYNNTGDKIIVSARGANAGFVNRISKPYWAGNSCYSVGIKNPAEISWGFVYYFLKNSEHELIGDQQKGGIPALSKKQMEVFRIPIPYPNDPKKSLAEQCRIAAILDKFDTLTHSISEGLPREIELRQKQYAYYRDLLLSFPKPEVVA